MLNLIRSLVYYLILLTLLYLFRFELYYLTRYALALILPIIVLRQIELRRNLKRRERGGRAGFIYTFSDIGQILPSVKIGRESVKGERMKSHRTGAPFGCIVWSTFWVGDSVYAESYLHRRYHWMRISRRFEWFLVLNPLMLVDLILLGKFNKKRR